MIGPDTEAAMRAAMARAEADAERAEAAAPGIFSGLWASFIRADPTADAARGLAAAARRDAERFRERFVALLASATATDAEGERFVADVTASVGAGAALAVEGAGALLTPGAALRETARGTTADLRELAGKAADAGAAVVGWGKWAVPVIALGLAALVARDFARRVRA